MELMDAIPVELQAPLLQSSTRDDFLRACLRYGKLLQLANVLMLRSFFAAKFRCLPCGANRKKVRPTSSALIIRKAHRHPSLLKIYSDRCHPKTDFLLEVFLEYSNILLLKDNRDT